MSLSFVTPSLSTLHSWFNDYTQTERAQFSKYFDDVISKCRDMICISKLECLN